MSRRSRLVRPRALKTRATARSAEPSSRDSHVHYHVLWCPQERLRTLSPTFASTALGLINVLSSRARVPSRLCKRNMPPPERATGPHPPLVVFCGFYEVDGTGRHHRPKRFFLRFGVDKQPSHAVELWHEILEYLNRFELPANQQCLHLLMQFRKCPHDNEY